MKKGKFKSFGSDQVEKYFECGWSRCSSHHIFYQNNEISHLLCTLLSWNMFLYHFEKLLVAGSVFIVDSHCSSWLPTLFITSKAHSPFQSMYKLRLSCSIRLSVFPGSWSRVSRAHGFICSLILCLDFLFRCLQEFYSGLSNYVNHQ